MPATQLDSRTALLVIDLQTGTMANPSAHPIQDVVARAAALAAAFRAQGLPVVLVNFDPAGGPRGRTEFGTLDIVLPDGWTTLTDELNSTITDILVTKNTWGAFAGTDLEARLEALRVTHVIVAGLATTYGVESTARQAYESGYNVTTVVDAMTDPSLDGHNHSVTRIFQVLGEVATTAEILALLGQRADH